MESKKRSEVWSYFEQIPNSRAKCNFCSQILSYKGGSTYNLNRHLKTKHPSSSVALVAKQTPGNSNNTLASASTSTLAEEETISQSHGIKDIPSTSFSNIESKKNDNSPPAKKQKTIGNFFTKPVTNKKRDNINKLLVETIAKNFLPFYLVESLEFKCFVSELNTGYQLPCRKTVSKVLIPQYYNLTKEKVRNQIQLADAICLTTDGWTSVTNESYVAVTAHYLNVNKIESYLLDCYKYTERHTAINLCEELQRIVIEWKISDKIVAVVSDNAANIVAAIRRTNWKHIPCFAHTINLVVQSSLETIQHIRKKIKIIVDFFRKSPQATEKLKQMQKQLGTPELNIKQDVVTRWNSTYDMFQRIIDIKESLMSVVAINYPTIENISNTDINTLEMCCDLLKIFKDVTQEISSEKEVTVSKVILFSSALTTYCKKYLNDHSGPDMPELVRNLAESLLTGLQKRFNNIEHNKIFAEATILDPRFKKFGFTDKKAFDAAKQNLISYASHSNAKPITNDPLTSEEQPKDITPAATVWEAFDTAVSKVVANPNPVAAGIVEVEKYLDEPLLPRQSNLFIWWEERRNVYPHLYELMRKTLCIVATSVPSERVFSKAGQTLTEKRNRLKGEKVSMLLFLNANL